MGGGGGRSPGSPVSDTGPPPPSPQGQPAPTHRPPGRPRAGRRLGPFVRRAPPLLGGRKVVQGSRREGAGGGRGGTARAAGPKSGEEGPGQRRLGTGRRAAAPKYAEGPLAGPGTRGERALQKFGGVDGCAPGGARGLSGRHFPSGPAFVSRVSCSCCVRPPPAVAAAEALARAEGRRRRRRRPRRAVQTGLWGTGCVPASRSGSSRRCCC